MDWVIDHSVLSAVLRQLLALSWLDSLLWGFYLIGFFLSGCWMLLVLMLWCFTQAFPSCYTHWPAFMLIPSCCVTKSELGSPAQICISVLGCSDSSEQPLSDSPYHCSGKLMDRQTQLLHVLGSIPSRCGCCCCCGHWVTKGVWTSGAWMLQSLMSSSGSFEKIHLSWLLTGSGNVCGSIKGRRAFLWQPLDLGCGR